MERPGETLSSRIKWLMILRMILTTFILLFTVFMQLRGIQLFQPLQLRGLYAISASAYLVTLAYAIFYHSLRFSPNFASLQLIVDAMLVTMLVLLSGGINSFFPVLYVFVILGAGIALTRLAALIIALEACGLYLLAVFLPFHRGAAPLLDPDGGYLILQSAQVAYRGTVNVVALVIVWLLGAYLSETLRRTGEALSAREGDLAELQWLYQSIVQNISSGLVTIDLDGRIITTNRAAEKILGRSAAECIGKSFFALVRINGDLNPLRYSWGRDETSVRAEGGLREGQVILGMTFSPLRGEQGGITGIICSFQDLTEIRKLEEQIKRSDRLAAIGEMAAGVAHEIRNPLASISGSIQVLREDLPIDENTRNLMDIVTHEAERLSDIINDFLLFANPRTPNLEPTPIGALVKETLDLVLASPLANRGHSFSIDDASRGRSFAVDRQMMKQVFWNLSLNAVQAMPGGGNLKVTISTQRGLGSSAGNAIEWLVIEFADNGGGIAAETMGKLFTPFFSTKEHGTGLGLSIVYKIMELHGGSVEVESTVGNGSLFRIKVPAALHPAPVMGGH